jgi:hypothetical protein
MKPWVLVFLPVFIAGCSCSDHADASAPTGPQGGLNPSRSTVSNDDPKAEIWNYLDPRTCANDVAAPTLETPMFVVPPVNPIGGRARAALVWSFCNPGRNDLPAQPSYKLLVSLHSQVVAQRQVDANCVPPRPNGNIGFPQECYPPVATGDLSLTISLPALASCQCHSEVAFINVPAGQEGTLVNLPPGSSTTTHSTTIPSGDYNFTLSAPWDVTIQTQEVTLQ